MILVPYPNYNSALVPYTNNDGAKAKEIIYDHVSNKGLFYLTKDILTCVNIYFIHFNNRYTVMKFTKVNPLIISAQNK